MKETTFISKCCNEKAIPDEQKDGSTLFTCLRCEKDCEVNEVCEHCFGTREVPVYGRDDETGYNSIVVGFKPCVCQNKVDGEND